MRSSSSWARHLPPRSNRENFRYAKPPVRSDRGFCAFLCVFMFRLHCAQRPHPAPASLRRERAIPANFAGTPFGIFATGEGGSIPSHRCAFYRRPSLPRADVSMHRTRRARRRKAFPHPSPEGCVALALYRLARQLCQDDGREHQHAPDRLARRGHLMQQHDPRQHGEHGLQAHKK